MSKFQIYLFYLSLFLSYFLGQNILFSLGYYESPKIYTPAILLMMVVCFPLILEIRQFREECNTFLFIIVMLGLTKFMGGDPDFKASIVSLVLPPLFLAFIVKNFNSINWEKLKSMLYIFIVLDCTMAIVERIRGACFFPDLPYETFFNESGMYMFRSYALLGHPLANSSTIMTIVLFILVFEKSMFKKNAIFILSVLALLCFNSRFSLLIMVAFYSLYVITDFTNRHITFKWKFFYVLVIIGGLYAVLYLFSLGWGDRLIENGLDDGSSQTRILIFDIFKNSSVYDFLWGRSYSDVVALKRMTGTNDLSIENPWITFLLRYGIIFEILGIYFYVKLFRKQLSYFTKYELFMTLCPWLLQISSSNSISNPSLALCQIFLYFYIFGENRLRKRLLYKL